MTRLLCRWFVKDADNVKNPKVRAAYGTLCSIVGIVLNILLFIGNGQRNCCKIRKCGGVSR